MWGAIYTDDRSPAPDAIFLPLGNSRRGNFASDVRRPENQYADTALFVPCFRACFKPIRGPQPPET